MMHDVFSISVALFALWFIISPRVPTGVFITAGLGAVFVVAVWSVDDGYNPDVALDIMLGAMNMIGLGVAWRMVVSKRKHPMRRAEDWTHR